MSKEITQDQLANMSDEEAMNLDANQLAFNSSAATTDGIDGEVDTDIADTNKEEEAASTQSEVTDEDIVNNVKEEAANGSEDGKVDNAEKDAAGNPADTTKEDDGKGKKDAQDKPADGQSTGDAPATVTDDQLKEFHAKITGKFKANGREMQVANADEALQLMQMGANYNKKMQALRPNLALMRMLENAGLLNEEKLSYLIDLEKKNPEAINKLVKESGIDPLELSAEKAGDYRPGNHKVSEKELALDEVWSALEGAEGFDRTANLIGAWDEKSRAAIADTPKVLEVLTSHMAAGMYDMIAEQVERERTFGRLTGLSDLEAYRQVGEAMAESGKFEHVMGKANPSSQQTAPAKVVADTKPKQADDSNRRDKRKAASPTRAAAPSSKATVDFNILSISDDELMKLDISKFG